MDTELRQKLEENRKLIEEVYVSVEKTRKMFLWTLILSVVLFVLPLIGLVFAIPAFLSAVTGGMGGL